MPTAERRRVRFWRPEVPSVLGMVRVEGEDRLRTTYAEHFLIMVVCEGVFEGWSRGDTRMNVPGSVKLKDPGDVPRDLRVHAPFTLQGATFSDATVSAAAEALGVRGRPHFKASGFGPDTRAARRACAMHEALARPDAPAIERDTLIAEALAEVIDGEPRALHAPHRREVQRARAYLHDAVADKVTLDDLAGHARLDKFHLVRAFRAEIGLPPYEYLTHVRVAKAREHLQRGERVAQVAQVVGFCDESQLHRHFRRIVGVPPGVYARGFISERTRQHRPRRAHVSHASSTNERTRSQ
jgi:AraC-like DNA-binding protein